MIMASIEFDHAMGFNAIPAIFHGKNFVIGDLLDAHSQVFLRQHDEIITCLTLSVSGKWRTSRYIDIFVWDFETRQILYRFEEHDYKVESHYLFLRMKEY